MITTNELERFAKVRAELFDAIRSELEIDGYCKSYEGQFSIIFPNYFDAQDQQSKEAWGIKLDCYLIGPGRHYDWLGATLAEALSKMEADVRQWIQERGA